MINQILPMVFLKYNFELKPGEKKIIYLAVPFYGEETLSENLRCKKSLKKNFKKQKTSGKKK